MEALHVVFGKESRTKLLLSISPNMLMVEIKRIVRAGSALSGENGHQLFGDNVGKPTSGRLSHNRGTPGWPAGQNSPFFNPIYHLTLLLDKIVFSAHFLGLISHLWWSVRRSARQQGRSRSWWRASCTRGTRTWPTTSSTRGEASRRQEGGRSEKSESNPRSGLWTRALACEGRITQESKRLHLSICAWVFTLEYLQLSIPQWIPDECHLLCQFQQCCLSEY